MKPNIKKFPTVKQASKALTVEIQDTLTSAPGHISMAVSGGSTPLALFRELAALRETKKALWKKLHLFWVDERCVPPGDDESNYGTAKRILLDNIMEYGPHVYRIRGEDPPQHEAVRYSALVADLLCEDAPCRPQFDWILLGMGDDGHTASIFPGQHELLKEAAPHYAVSKHPASGQKRITMSMPLINKARRISFFVAGTSKAKVAGQILNRSAGAAHYPAAHVGSPRQKVEWYVDESAAADLRSDLFL